MARQGATSLMNVSRSASAASRIFASFSFTKLNGLAVPCNQTISCITSLAFLHASFRVFLTLCGGGLGKSGLLHFFIPRKELTHTHFVSGRTTQRRESNSSTSEVNK